MKINKLKELFEFEKHSLLRMYGGELAYDSDGNLKRNSLKIVLSVLIGVCVGRGIFVGYVWKTGSFLSGFAYPFILLAIIALGLFPIFVVQRKYKGIEFEEEEIKPSKIKTFLKIIGAILYIPFCLIGIPIIMEDIVFAGVFGKDFTYIMTSDLYVIYCVAVLCLFMLLIYLYSKHGILRTMDGSEGLRARLPKKTKRKVLLHGILVFTGVLFIYLFWFDLFTEDGAVMQRLFIHREYTWDDVDYYTLGAGTDGILEFTVVMEDGVHMDCLGSSSSSSNLPEGKYPDMEEDYCRYLTKLFSERGIELRVDDWEKLYNRLNYDYWINYAEEIRELAY